jgi:hypothetical protein
MIPTTYLKPDSECGFGLCAGDANCRDKHCPGHPCNLVSLPVIDAKFFDEQRAKTADMPIQYADGFEPNPWWPRLIVALFIVVIAAIVLSNDIAGYFIHSR